MYRLHYIGFHVDHYRVDALLMIGAGLAAIGREWSITPKDDWETIIAKYEIGIDPVPLPPVL